MNYSISEKINKIVANATVEICKDLVTQLSEVYHFNLTEAMSHLNVKEFKVVKKEPKEKKLVQKKKIIPLPFTGVIYEDCCQAVQKNYGLFTQCLKPKKEGCNFCKTCNEQALSNPSNKPKNGIIQEREQNLSGFKGIKPFNQVIKKLNITVEMVREEAIKKNITLPEDVFEDVVVSVPSKKKGGRPKKSETTTTITSEETPVPIEETPVPIEETPVPIEETPVSIEETPVVPVPETPVPTPLPTPVPTLEQPKKEVKKQQPKGKGKVNIVEQKGETSEEEDKKKEEEKRKKEEMKKQVAKEKALQKRIEKENEEKEKERLRIEQLNKETQDNNDDVMSDLDEDYDDEGEAIETEEIVIKGKKYLMDNKHTLYDCDTQEPVGVWNPETKVLKKFTN